MGKQSARLESIIVLSKQLIRYIYDTLYENNTSAAQYDHVYRPIGTYQICYQADHCLPGLKMLLLKILLLDYGSKHGWTGKLSFVHWQKSGCKCMSTTEA